MISSYLTILLSFVMGFSVFLSMPIIFHKGFKTKQMLFLNAAAIGILVFLMLDVYGDVANAFGNYTLSNPLLLIFIAGFSLSFLFFITPRSSRDPEESPKRTSMLAAVGIGFQNVTEGLLFGSAGAAGLLPIYIISIIGFSLQNLTEGFPISAPLIGLKEKVEKWFVVSAFLVSGIPTIIGTVIGLVFFSNYFLIFFDSLASAAILYVVLVLFHVNMSKCVKEAKKDIKLRRQYVWLTYAGILAGFVVAFILNYAVVY
ncbi:MAG: hypothetical protein QXF01_00810 [Candidatus Micrarchaeaceae archaeon]